jgi:hypothetical protein
MNTALDDATLVARFREIEAKLDAELNACRRQLETLGFDIRDSSNRSGFDKTGFPYFVWSHSFDLETRAGDLVDLVRVQLEYQQPVVDAQDERLSCTRSHETFQIGATGTKRSAKRTFPLIELEQGLLYRVVVEEAQLAKVY